MSKNLNRPSTNVPASRWSSAFRPTLLFVAAFALNSTPHEAVHALAAYWLGFNSTLFQLWVNPDPAGPSPTQMAIIAAAGPIFSLSLGLISWVLYQRRFRERSAGLLFLMLAVVGTYSFIGPLAGTALGGDFNIVATSLKASAAVRYGASAIGFLLLPTFLFLMGRELVRWAPSSFTRTQAVATTTIAPWLIGTTLTLLVYWPLPSSLIGSTLSGSVPWVFVVIGAALRPAGSGHAPGISSITRADLAITILVLALVRLLASGVRLTH